MRQFLRRGLIGVLAAAMLPTALPFASAANASFKHPDAPMTVDENIITIATYYQAFVTPEVLGLNNMTASNKTLPYTYLSLEQAGTVPMLGVFGSDINESPNPYLYNYFYNCYAKEAGLSLADQHTMTQTISSAAADLTVMEEFGGTSMTLSLRPDILMVMGDDATKDYLPLIAELPENKDNDPDNDYDPYLVKYPMQSTYSFLESLYDLAETANQITAETGKTGRYGDPMVIAANVEKYAKGLQSYVLSRLAADGAEKKVVAIVDPINSADGIFYAVDSTTSTKPGSSNQSRAGEYVADTTLNIANLLGKTVQTGDVGEGTNRTYYVLTAEEIAQADIIITSAIQNEDGNEAEFRELLLAYVDPSDTEVVEKLETMPILSTRPDCVGSLAANAMENLLGMAYWTAYCYPEYLNPIYVATYFYQNFYHISDNTSLQTAIAANFAEASIPEGYGYTTDISGYDPAEVENAIIAGMKYYEAHEEQFEGTLLYTAGYTGAEGWDIDWTVGIGAGQQSSQQQPETQQPSVPASGTAYARTQSITVDGKAITFQTYALKDANGYETNYVKLRDVASVLNGTGVQFNVTWDGAVNIQSKTAYAPDGSEMSTPFTGDRAYTAAAAVTKVDGTAADLDAILLQDDTGAGYTYYKLRDLGQTLGFNVTWAADTGITVDSATPYQGN